jgi:phenylalanyl-tRNA synthetase alpha chain
MLKARIEQIKAKSLKEIEGSQDEKSLYGVKVKNLGRKGELTEILKGLKGMDASERRNIGPIANQARQEIEREIEKRRKELGEKIDWEKEKIDVTLPGTKAEIGSLHPITLVYREIERIFSSMGVEVIEGPEIETEWYNFDALNIPADHPARDEWDTFWIKSTGKSTRHSQAVSVQNL